MFDDYKGFIDIEEVLKNEYNYTFNGDLRDLYSQPFIELEGEGTNALCWIKYRGNSYLFKHFPDFKNNVWGELLSQEFAKKLGLPCAEYHAAYFRDKKGVLSKQMLKEDETLILGYEVFQDFFTSETKKGTLKETLKKKYDSYLIPEEIRNYNSLTQSNPVFSRLNTLDQVWDILAERKDLKSEEVPNIINSYVNMLLFDIFTLQGDRHPNNWGLIKKGDTYRASPLFDNSTSFGLGFPFMDKVVTNFKNAFMYARFSRDYEQIDKIVYLTRPSFTLSSDNIKNGEKESSLDVFRDFIRKTGSESIKYIEPFFREINELNLENMIEKVSLENGIEMGDDLLGYIYNVFSYHQKKLATVMDMEYQGGSKNNAGESSKRI